MGEMMCREVTRHSQAGGTRPGQRIGAQRLRKPNRRDLVTMMIAGIGSWDGWMGACPCSMGHECAGCDWGIPYVGRR